eukprot:gene4272-3089_t
MVQIAPGSKFVKYAQILLSLLLIRKRERRNNRESCVDHKKQLDLTPNTHDTTPFAP